MQDKGDALLLNTKRNNMEDNMAEKKKEKKERKSGARKSKIRDGLQKAGYKIADDQVVTREDYRVYLRLEEGLSLKEAVAKRGSEKKDTKKK